MTVAFKKAERSSVRLKLAVDGPSGSGKTLGALALARTLAGTGTVAVIDTENGSASLYGDKYAFDVLDLAPPFTSARYYEAMQAAAEAGYAVLVIDSLSHQWNGDGGILARKEEMDKRPGSNSYTNWATFTKEHTAFVAKMLQLPVHVIATMRSKHDYILETNDRGKQTPRKVGMAPVQREGLEYEFSTVFNVGMDHRATASKDRTGLFGGDEPINLVEAATGKKLLAWLATGKPWEPPTPIAVESQQWGGKALGEHSDDELREIIKEHQDAPTRKRLVAACRTVLANRQLTPTPAPTDDQTVEKMKAGVAAETNDLPFL